MSRAQDASADELLEMMQGDPEDVLRDNMELLEEMRDETDSEVLTDYIDALLNQFRKEDEAR